MPNARASRGLILLDNHLATGTEATYTFTKTLDMKNTYRTIIIYFTGKTTATLSINLKINAATDYDYSELKGDTTTASTGLGAADSVISLIPSSLLDGANSFQGKIEITLNDSNDLLTATCICAASHEGQTITQAEVQTSSTTVTSIEILTSTSTWIAGTEITTYGLLR